MSAIFFRRFLSQPTRVASIVPSSKTLRRKVAEKFDFSQPRVIAEFGPGEGCHTREILSRMHPGSQLLLFELDEELARMLRQQFASDPRVVVLHTDAQNLAEELERLGHQHCDYVVSGIPFSILEVGKKRALLQKIHDSLSPEPHAAFIIYQVTNELRAHATLFPRQESEYCLQNLPPMFVTVFYRLAAGANGKKSAPGPMANTRTEKDSMGTMEVPATALYGASTQRAVLNFPISGYRFSREFIRALGLIKWAASEANFELGRLSEAKADLISAAAEEVIQGQLDSHFPLDIFQTGSGTSTNMNANEVISNRCSQLAGKAIGSKEPVHPNDDVNLGQSSNDVIPTAIHVAVGEALRNQLMPALEELEAALDRKALEFWDIIKIGRTHLMDATPVRLGQTFRGYARQIELGRLRVGNSIAAIEELALGGTAVGTGLNCHPDFPGKVMHHLWNRTGISFREARNHFEAQGSKDGLVQVSGLLKTVAVSLFKIANDLRWLSSGPRCGIGEIQLPATQPGSSIMPGKVNPVMSEAMMQVCAQVFGNDATITWAGANGNFELNVMMPVLAHNLLESIRLLTNATEAFRAKAVEGITANEARCNELVEYSMAMVTSLAPIIGYDRAAEIAKESAKTGRTVREICREQQVLPPDELEAALDPVAMTEPGGEGAAGG